jgi:hypothetical protein
LFREKYDSFKGEWKLRKIFSGVLVTMLLTSLFPLVFGIQPVEAQPVTWITQTVDSAGDVGRPTCLAYDPLGYPAIAYYDYDNYALKYAHWDGTSWTINIVDNVGPATNNFYSYYISLVFDPSGNPAIGYYNAEPYWDLKYAHFNGVSWEIKTVYDDGLNGGWGRCASLAFDTIGNPSIAFRKMSGIWGLGYAHWNGISWDVETVDSGYGTGAHASLRFDLLGNRAIAYHWQGSYGGPTSLRYAYFDGTTWNIKTMDSESAFPSLAFDSSGNPAISYFYSANLDVKYAHWSGLSWDIETVVGVGDVGEYTSLAFDGLGKPAISYYDSTNKDLKHAQFDGSKWNIETVDSQGDVGQYCSFAFGPSGYPDISYYDSTNGDLKYAHKPVQVAPQKMVKPVEGEMYYSMNAFRGYYNVKSYPKGDPILNTLVFKTGFHENDGEIIKNQKIYAIYKVYHEGIDIFTEPEKGKSIYAPASGTVVYIDNVDNSPAGKWVWIWHGDITKRDGTVVSKISTRYLHLNTIDEELLKHIIHPEGAVDIPVSQGTEIGTVGDTGCPPDVPPHLHFEAREGSVPEKPTGFDVYDTIPIDPLEFLDYQPPDPKPPQLNVYSACPVDLIVIDPDGLIISKEINQLPTLAQYIEVKNRVGEEESLLNCDEISIYKRKIGRYLITVIPEQGTNPTGAYNLLVVSDELTLILATNIQVSNIPTQPYILESTETEIIPIIPATVDFAPDTLNLKSKGTWVTVYIELPVGHGYDVSMIDLTSMMLNVKLQAETKPIGIGDYDGDGIPDLMIKFSRKAVQNILKVGDKVEVTISGKLIDGRLFEGNDKIIVIS